MWKANANRWMPATLLGATLAAMPALAQPADARKSNSASTVIDLPQASRPQAPVPPRAPAAAYQTQRKTLWAGMYVAKTPFHRTLRMPIWESAEGRVALSAVYRLRRPDPLAGGSYWGANAFTRSPQRVGTLAPERHWHIGFAIQFRFGGNSSMPPDGRMRRL